MMTLSSALSSATSVPGLELEHPGRVPPQGLAPGVDDDEFRRRVWRPA